MSSGRQRLSPQSSALSPRMERLQRGEDFARVYREGRSWAHPLLVLRAAPGEGGATRYGFAVGKRLGKAVVRNRVKRRLREAARLTAVAPGWDIVLTARPPAVEATYHDLKATFQQLLRRAGLLLRPSVQPSGSDGAKRGGEIPAAKTTENP